MPSYAQSQCTEPNKKQKHFDLLYHLISYYQMSHLKMVFFCHRRGVLGMHEVQGIDDIGSLRWQNVLCLLAIYIICYFSLWKGISTSGKVL